jgi:hypothetical protein
LRCDQALDGKSHASAIRIVGGHGHGIVYAPLEGSSVDRNVDLTAVAWFNALCHYWRAVQKQPHTMLSMMSTLARVRESESLADRFPLHHDTDVLLD